MGIAIETAFINNAGVVTDRSSKKALSSIDLCISTLLPSDKSKQPRGIFQVGINNQRVLSSRLTAKNRRRNIVISISAKHSMHNDAMQIMQMKHVRGR